MQDKIQLLQLFICREFRQEKQDCFTAGQVMSNLYVPKFPVYLRNLLIVTCWQKDRRFHKEVIEYATDYGTSTRSPHMDVEPITNSVLFRWHKHPFPSDFPLKKPTVLKVRVILDAQLRFESCLLVERTPSQR